MENAEEATGEVVEKNGVAPGGRRQKDFGYKTEDKKKKRIDSVVFVFLSAFIYATAFHYFVSTSRFAPGGIGGIIAMLQHLVNSAESSDIGVIAAVQWFMKWLSTAGGVDYSPILIIVINVAILIPASRVLSKEFAVKTFFTTLIMTIILFLLDNFLDPDYKFSIASVPLVGDVGTRLVSAIIGGALCGISMACAFKVNASTGGADIVGAMLQKKNPHRSVAFMIFIVNGIIMLISFFVYADNLMPVFLSLIYIYISSVVCDYMLQGSKSALKFEVITEHAEDISEEIIEKLGHGVTITPAEGMFEHKNKSLLICVIKPRQISKFQTIIRKYPDTFAYVGKVNEVIGKFNNGDDK